MILVIAEHREGKLTANSKELVVFAQRAGRDLGMPVQTVILGADGVNIDVLQTARIERIFRSLIFSPG